MRDAGAVDPPGIGPRHAAGERPAAIGRGRGSSPRRRRVRAAWLAARHLCRWSSVVQGDRVSRRVGARESALPCAVVSLRAAPASILLLAACASGEPTATSYGPPAVSSVTLAGSSSGEVVVTSEGGDSDDTTGGASSSSSSGEPATTTAPPTGDTTTEATAVDPTTSVGDDTTTSVDACGGPCDAPPGPCHVAVGQCIVGECVYSQFMAGEACDDGDGCTQGDVCDGAGVCQGAAIVCEAANASGGACVDGACAGFVCTAPYEDCDGDMSNGCEVPVGVANQCDAGGLNPDGGCWTAYCGSSGKAGATNFGTYYCSDCSTCNTPGNGLWQWCNHSTGNWYDPAAGSCGASEDLVCPP